jgi:hypothetical protein
MGENGHIVENMTVAEEREFHGLELCKLYDGLPPFVRADISLLTFVAYSSSVEETATILHADHHKLTREHMTKNVVKFQITARGLTVLVLRDLPTNAAITPEEINGCLEAATSGLPVSTTLDPWGYCSNGRLVQSYNTCKTSVLFSTTTAINLTGESVHFMMFQSGRHALQCRRFSFGTSALDSNAAATGNRRQITPQFLKELGLNLNPNLTKSLQVHAIRLDKVQHILNQDGGYWLESHAQILFQSHSQ